MESDKDFSLIDSIREKYQTLTMLTPIKKISMARVNFREVLFISVCILLTILLFVSDVLNTLD